MELNKFTLRAIIGINKFQLHDSLHYHVSHFCHFFLYRHIKKWVWRLRLKDALINKLSTHLSTQNIPKHQTSDESRHPHRSKNNHCDERNRMAEPESVHLSTSKGQTTNALTTNDMPSASTKESPVKDYSPSAPPNTGTFRKPRKSKLHLELEKAQELLLLGKRIFFHKLIYT